MFWLSVGNEDLQRRLEGTVCLFQRAVFALHTAWGRECSQYVRCRNTQRPHSSSDWSLSWLTSDLRTVMNRPAVTHLSQTYLCLLFCLVVWHVFLATLRHVCKGWLLLDPIIRPRYGIRLPLNLTEQAGEHLLCVATTVKEESEMRASLGIQRSFVLYSSSFEIIYSKSQQKEKFTRLNRTRSLMFFTTQYPKIKQVPSHSPLVSHWCPSGSMGRDAAMGISGKVGVPFPPLREVELSTWTAQLPFWGLKSHVLKPITEGFRREARPPPCAVTAGGLHRSRLLLQQAKAGKQLSK